jgi:F-type H+-transporting ATPase subunit gamma
MAETLKVLKKRLRSIRNTEHITHAMEMVAANKLRRTENLLKGGAPYFRKIEELIIHLAREASGTNHPLVVNPKQDPPLFVVITADRGLCGSFNNHLLNFAANEIRKSASAEKYLYLVGRKSRQLVTFFPDAKVIGEKMDLNGKITLKDAMEILAPVKDAYMSKKVNSVYIISFVSLGGSKTATQVNRFLPIDVEKIKNKYAQTADHSEKQDKTQLDFIFEPSVNMVLGHLFEEYIASKLYATVLEQFMCEHRFRMLSMNNATKSCQELNETLTLKMNKARQGAITKELLDIVGGAEAIS